MIDEHDVDAASRATALAFARQDGNGGALLPIVVVLHDRGGDSVSAIGAARARFGLRADLVAPQAARPCNPFQSNLQSAPGYAGFSWYLGDAPERPEAASFGDVLAGLEEFTADLARPFVLTGHGQGAVLALTLALHALPGLVAVHASGAVLPRIHGWELPHTRLDGLEAVLDDDIRAEARETLEARGARVRVAPSEFDAAAWIDTLAQRAGTEQRK